MSGKYWTKCGKLFLRDGKPIFSDVCPCPFGALLVRVDYGLDSSQNPYQLPYYEGAVFWGLVSIKNEKLYYQDIELDKEIYQPDGSYYIIRKYKCIKDLQTFNDYKIMQPFCFFENLYIESGTSVGVISRRGYYITAYEFVEYQYSITTWTKSWDGSELNSKVFNLQATSEATLYGMIDPCSSSCTLTGDATYHASGGGSDINEPFETTVSDITNNIETLNVPFSINGVETQVSPPYVLFSMNKINLTLYAKFTNMYGEYESYLSPYGDIVSTQENMNSSCILNGTYTRIETQDYVIQDNTGDPELFNGSYGTHHLRRTFILAVGNSYAQPEIFNQLSEDLK